ncbi:hypothetical protein CLIB1423_28S01002 [[Candida] railenensis]|uniref:Transcription elongation factor Eaf N-terminal domain-containing protein n=1 Tax=[Candida] railenensis TaxID=45579 RepID=A0A9P0QV19_9ASCO|nr:hypothetical protein CLIB1423_28S01002 [[Candida] railenensis]
MTTLPDGEYDIDLSILQNSTHDPSLAIRYGFVPDSMDQNKPITLYQTDQELILKASSIEDGQSIIFEGMGKSTSNSAPADSFYLSYINGNIHLNKLKNTVRVNKSRNMAKWNAKIQEWNKVKPKTVQVPKIRPESERSAPVRPEPARADPIRPRAVASKRPSSKRPPKREEVKEESPIISESDFEDLENEFPEFTFDQEPAVEKEKPKTTITEKPPISGKRPTTDVKAKGPEKGKDVDDDFKDLEDQLQEVLEDDIAIGDIDDSDDDDDDFDDVNYGGTGVPIRIEIDEGEPAKSVKNTPTFTYSPAFQNENKKPMSLKELMRGKRGDYDSSSEEE